MTTGSRKWGEKQARDALARFLGTFATTALLTAVPQRNRPDGAIAYVKGAGFYEYDLTSTATASGGDVLAPDAGTGRWFSIGSGAAGVNRAKTLTARNATTTTLAAYTRTANVILADANGAIGDIDGVTNVAGDLILLKNGAAGADNGLYVLDVVGTAGTKYQLTRAPGYDTSDEVTDGDLIAVREGTANADKTFRLTTNETITLNTTSLTFREELDAEILASTANGEGASLVAIEDAGAFTSAADVEAALAEIYQHIASAQAQVNVPIMGALEADGTVLAAFADGASPTPGLSVTDSEAVGIRWNNHANPDPIAIQVPMPQDLDDSADVVVHLMASKTGATLGDAVTWDVGAFFLTDGALHDADADAGGTSSAMTGDAAAKTVQEETLTIGNADVPASPSVLTLTIQPTDGTLGTDDVILEGVWLEYTRKILTA